jgi:hypothetical protein
MGDVFVNLQRKLLVEAVNILLDKGYIDWHIPPEPPEQKWLHIFCEIFGRNSVVMWMTPYSGEIAIVVWWDYNHEKNPRKDFESFAGYRPLAKSHSYSKFVGGIVSAWLEREYGRYLCGRGTNGLYQKYIRSSERAFLENMVAIPRGFQFEESSRTYS